jgi:type I restriction enzyme, S subunit
MERLPANWKLCTLGEVATGFLSGGTPSTKNEGYWNGAVPWITSKWLNSRLYLDTGEKFISEDAVRQSATTVVPRNNLIFATRVGVGKVAVNRLNLAINQDLAGVLIDSERYDIGFLAYQLRSERVQNIVESHKRGATIQGITRENLKDLELYLPPLSEQRKIAAVLALVQRAIEQQEGLITLTTELKKALLHKLFTEGLRGEPQKQTEIGPVPESWKLMPLGSLAKVGNGSTPKRDKAGYWHGGTIPWLNSTKIHERFITGADQFVTDLAVKECHLPHVKPNSLLVAITGQGKTLGNSAVVLFETCINQHLAYAQFSTTKVLPEFVLWFMQTRYEHLRSISQAGGSTKGALTCGYLKTYPIPVPSLEEQREIADVFAALDMKQKVHERKHAAITDLFRNLLHQLMTAQIRVNNLNLDEILPQPVAEIGDGVAPRAGAVVKARGKWFTISLGPVKI